MRLQRSFAVAALCLFAALANGDDGIRERARIVLLRSRRTGPESESACHALVLTVVGEGDVIGALRVIQFGERFRAIAVPVYASTERAADAQQCRLEFVCDGTNRWVVNPFAKTAHRLQPPESGTWVPPLTVDDRLLQIAADEVLESGDATPPRDFGYRASRAVPLSLFGPGVRLPEGRRDLFRDCRDGLSRVLAHGKQSVIPGADGTMEITVDRSGAIRKLAGLLRPVHDGRAGRATRFVAYFFDYTHCEIASPDEFFAVRVPEGYRVGTIPAKHD